MFQSALAAAADPRTATDRRAWHQAQAAEGPDEQLAAQLERSADQARARGGFAQAAVFLERAVAMTPDPIALSRRALAAAHAEYLAGDFAGALVLNVSLARDTYLEAVAAALFVGRLATKEDLVTVARAALAAPAAAAPRASDLLLDGLATLVAAGDQDGAPLVRRALAEFCRADLAPEEAIRWLWLACRAAIDVWDFERWDLISRRLVGLARRSGAVVALPLALMARVGMDLLLGDLPAARAAQEESEAVLQATGSRLAPYGRMLLLAWQGARQEAGTVITSTLREVRSRGEGQGLAAAYQSQAVLLNGLGR
jgi:hypothetical protein